MLAMFPPKHPSEASGEEEDGWYFLLDDGKLSGGASYTNHFDMMGVTNDELEPEGLKRAFCEQHKVIRICYSKKHLYVEIFDIAPNEAQWAAIGCLYRRDSDAKIVWDVWKNDAQKWLHGDGTIGQFKRAIDPTSEPRERRSAKTKRARPKPSVSL
jgi:hypothetical protein